MGERREKGEGEGKGVDQRTFLLDMVDRQWYLLTLCHDNGAFGGGWGCIRVMGQVF